MLREIVFLLSLCLAAPTAVSGATIYRWVDAQGRAHFGDQPAPGAAQIPDRAMPASGTQAPSASADCEVARQRLQQYRDAESIIEEDALGQRRTLDAVQHAQLLERTQARVRDTCGADSQ